MDSEMNMRGLKKSDYMGSKSTLCMGCGHDSVTAHLISALYESSVDPYRVAKMSGIGCSSKTPAYFLSKSHGFNSLHGRMAAVTTGAYLANRTLTFVGVSGDGDTASIGLGGFLHLIRRNVPMVYIIENNGVYGLTKGQFSATADLGMASKWGDKNPYSEVDLCTLALDVGCDFVARSFSGDGKQLTSLLALALRHPGTAVIDVISPCIAFANHVGSPKSYEYVKGHLHRLHELGFVQPQQELLVDYAEGEVIRISLADGAQLILRKLDTKTHDIKDRMSAISLAQSARGQGEILTGLYYWNPSTEGFGEKLHLLNTPLGQQSDKELIPSPSVLEEMMSSYF